MKNTNGLRLLNSTVDLTIWKLCFQKSNLYSILISNWYGSFFTFKINCMPLSIKCSVQMLFLFLVFNACNIVLCNFIFYLSLLNCFHQYCRFLLGINLMAHLFRGHVYNCQSQNQLPLHIGRFFLCPPPHQPMPNQPIKHFLINTHQGWTAFISTKSNGSRVETIKSISLFSTGVLRLSAGGHFCQREHFCPAESFLGPGFPSCTSILSTNMCMIFHLYF